MATRTPPPNRSPGQFVPSVDWNELPRGEMIRDTMNGNSTSTPGISLILSESLTMPADRQFQLFATVQLRSSIAGAAQTRLSMDGVQVQRKNQQIASSDGDIPVTIFASVQPSSGAHTFTTHIGVSGVAGNEVIALASTGMPCQMIGNDMGPQYS